MLLDYEINTLKQIFDRVEPETTAEVVSVLLDSLISRNVDAAKLDQIKISIIETVNKKDRP